MLALPPPRDSRLVTTVASRYGPPMSPRAVSGALALLCVGCLEPSGYPFGAEADTTGTTGTSSTSTDTGDSSGSTQPASDGSSTGTSTTGDTTDPQGTSTSGTTTADAPFCGDGLLNGPNQDVPYPEECDDGNLVDDDGCALCLRDRVVFISSETYKGDELNGLIGADNRCRGLATLAGLPNAATFKAWLSDSQTSVSDRMVHGLGRYVLVNNLPVASSWDALVNGDLMRPIDVTEASLTKKDTVWTGTNPDGTTAAGADHCADCGR